MVSNDSLKIALIGYGKMGKEIEKVLKSRGHSVLMIIDENNQSDLNTDNLIKHGINAAIEFTSPQSAFSNVKACLEAGIPIVSGTTGWNDRLDEAKEICKKSDGALFWSSNYSIGVNVMFKINRELAAIMDRFPDYDVTVEETHHRFKKDYPSGTAITLAGDILEGIERKTEWVAGPSPEFPVLGVGSVRRSDVPGDHTVIYESEIDKILLTHSAKNRRGFALGAVLAAEFLIDKKGVFGMPDLLGF